MHWLLGPNGVTSFSVTLLLLLLLCNASGFAHAEMEDDVMGCALCSIVVEAMMVGRTPAKALTLAYRRCATMGLMEPVCDQMVERNAKQLLGMSNNVSTAKDICSTLRLCEI